jgi:hypothetical protein
MSHKIYKGQTLAPIELDTGYDLATATNQKILFRRPDKTTGAWVATITGTKLRYQLQAGDINAVGYWTVQSYFEVDGKKAYGDIITILFEQPNE